MKNKSFFRFSARICGVALAAMLMSACATPPTDPEARKSFDEANDPLEPTNRTVFEFNMAFDKYLLKPVAEGYRWSLPDDTRAVIRRVLANLRAPVTFGNDVLQGNMGRAMETLMRMTVNTIMGMGGMFDVAGQYGLQRHEEDFGQTLAVWGFDEGPYIMLPIFGPSNIRDAIGLGVDAVADPLGWFIGTPELFARAAVGGIDRRSEVIEPLDELERTSVDFYATIRSLYRQRRNDEINNGAPGMNLPAPSISYDFPDDEKIAEPPPPRNPAPAPAAETPAAPAPSLVAKPAS
ncbi:MAG: VacJ family lipoprotein [Alphaproteobacteria bacterium]|nr:VacJ family lipoprotein [Alphaproteobacteria bacterium]